MKEIRLSNGMIAKVDDGDYEYLSQFKWHYRNGYALRNNKIRRSPYSTRMHREILNLGDSEYVDHIDRDRLNNQKNNLRVSTYAQNCCNKSKPATKPTSSKYIGVFKDGSRDRWIAKVRGGGKTKSRSYYLIEKDAALARDRMAEELHGEFARLNFPGETGNPMPQKRLYKKRSEILKEKEL